MHSKFWSKTPEGRDYVGYVIVDGIIILKRILDVVRNCVDLMTISYEYCTELSCYVKVGNMLGEELSDFCK